MITLDETMCLSLNCGFMGGFSRGFTVGHCPECGSVLVPYQLWDMLKETHYKIYLEYSLEDAETWFKSIPTALSEIGPELLVASSHQREMEKDQ